MTEAQYASIAGTLSADLTDVDFKPSPAAIARRSISIFSRRGTEDQDTKASSINQAAMSRCTSNKIGDRQQTWFRRKSLEARGSREHPKGTILKAVPPAERLRMLRLEEEMATSPNDEILSAISEHPAIQQVWTTNPHTTAQDQTSPSTSIRSGKLRNQGNAHRTESTKIRDANNRIGVWVDGVTHWDLVEPTSPRQLKSEDVELLRQQYHDLVDHSDPRPTLKVAIPGSTPVADVESSGPVAKLREQRMSAPTAPASIVNRFGNAPTPAILFRPTTNDFERAVEATESSSDPKKPTSGPLVEYRHSSASTASSNVQPSDVSVYSQRSSTTSVDPTWVDDLAQHRSTSPELACQEENSLRALNADFSNNDDASPFPDLNKPLPKVPCPNRMRAAPAPPSTPAERVLWRSMRSTSLPNFQRLNHFALVPIVPRIKTASPSLLNLEIIDAEFIRASPHALGVSDIASEPDSPTLSQAEHDLHAQLGTISEALRDSATDTTVALADAQRGTLHAANAPSASMGVAGDTTEPGFLKRADSVRSVMQPPSRAPTLPKRSRKREWRTSSPVATSATTPPSGPSIKAPGRRRSESLLIASSDAPHPQDVKSNQVHRSGSERLYTGVNSLHHGVTLDRPTYHHPELNGFRTSDTSGDATQNFPFRDHELDLADASPEEDVLLRIMSALCFMGDLFNMAVINKGMYRVFKENELHLIKAVAGNQSPAGWELREWRLMTRDHEADMSDEAASQPSAASNYLRSQRRDEAVINQMRTLILTHCQTFIRRETALAFAYPRHPDAQRFTDAFWRIWTFCTIFGCRKGREEDITGQLDWLKGGLFANNSSSSATVITNLDFDMGSVLLNAPEHFAQGNAEGLSATQLFDLTELWNCLSSLLAGYQGQVLDARRCGVFDDCEVRDGDVELEEHMLEEWLAFVLTLGPQAVLDLANHADNDTSAGFELARANGWTKWTPSETGSRATFLKEPVARLYEERISAAAMMTQDPHEPERKETARKRVAALAAEIRLRRQTSGYKRLPVIDMHSERPMSMISRCSSIAPPRPMHDLETSNVHPALRRQSYFSQPAGPSSLRSHEGIISPLSHTPTVASAASAYPGAQCSTRPISTIIEDRVGPFNRSSLASLEGRADTTVEIAVRKITDMGFNRAQATHALRMTDMGDGLRVDRAVDLLLRN